MEDWSSRRVRTLVTLTARRGLSVNKIACALISMMARSTCSNRKPNTLTQDRISQRRPKPLAPRGRTIHWVNRDRWPIAGEFRSFPNIGHDQMAPASLIRAISGHDDFSPKGVPFPRGGKFQSRRVYANGSRTWNSFDTDQRQRLSSRSEFLPIKKPASKASENGSNRDRLGNRSAVGANRT